ncbi:MAG: chemotaxis protein CheD [bacterium]
MSNINVGMGEMQISKSQGTVLIAPGLGSCIGLTMYDTRVKIAGMVHIVLPDSTNSTKNITLLGKYADTAIPELLEKMVKMGSDKKNLIVKIAGGAQMFTLEKGCNILNIGVRNVIAVKAVLNKMNLNLTAADTGGNKGRTFKIQVLSGSVFVKTIGEQEIEL